MINIALTIDAIEELANSFDGQSKIERLKTYAAIQILIRELSEYTKKQEEDGNRISNVWVYISELFTPFRCLARLEDTGHDDSQNSSWVRIGLEKLRSKHCFRIKA